MEDFRKYYDLENLFFPQIRHKVISHESLSAIDFFSILIWKANRAKSYHAKRLLEKRKGKSLDEIVVEISLNLYTKESKKERLYYLMVEWVFYLPTATAILAVMYPEDFTIFDIRACQALGIDDEEYNRIANKQTFDEKIWKDYEELEKKVRKEGVGESLREKDQYLWGKSFHSDLKNSIKNNFIK